MGTQKDGKWTGRLVKVFIALLLLAVLLLAGSIFGVNYMIDIWWFNALGYGFYYWQRLLYSYTVFGTVTLVLFIFFFFNFRLAARSFGKESGGVLSSPSLWSALAALALSIPIALPIFHNWETFLFYLFGRKMGITDPYLGMDASFYLFRLPLYTLIQRRLLLALVSLLVVLSLIYAYGNHRRQHSLLNFRGGDKWHLIIVLLLLSLAGIWDFLLQRYDLVHNTGHLPLFYGPGYAQMKVILPLIWVCVITLALAAVALTIAFYRRKGYKLAVFCLLLFLAAVALRNTQYLPHVVETYLVKPNELEKESPYISAHVRATLDAYKLTAVETREFTQKRLPAKKDVSLMDDILRNIPVWDAETLSDVFQQLQELRTYYEFPTVNVGRYDVSGRQQQVFLSPRELEFDNLPGQAINWINKHLTYTHGYGLVMTPASQTGGDPITWYLHNIPPQSQYGLSTEQPRIYYGLGKYTYSIAPNKTTEMDYPQGNSNVMTNYDGRGGVPIDSLFRKGLLAYAFKNKKIFFSTQITRQSRLLFRRNIIERIHHLVPFLQLDQTPYLAMTPDGIYWIVDAYTTSDEYPAAARRSINDTTFNYIRNSVKIVVDAYNGTIDLYLYDKTDPIINAYNSIYPGLFKSKDEMPDELKKHVRYPQDFFDAQMKIYAAYHQTEPHVFYQQEDLWTFADSVSENVILPLRPYYVTLDLIQSGKMEFLLLQPMFPKKRDNLRAVAVAGCDPDSYGKIVVYDFPKGQLAYGPAQIDALINQDPDIAEQFTLWDQAGSSVVRGKMLILLLEHSILFIQPVYIKATSRVKIPELQRIIMSEGEEVVMEKSIQDAYAALKQLVDVKHKDTSMNIRAPLKADSQKDDSCHEQDRTGVQPVPAESPVPADSAPSQAEEQTE